MLFDRNAAALFLSTCQNVANRCYDELITELQKDREVHEHFFKTGLLWHSFVHDVFIRMDLLDWSFDSYRHILPNFLYDALAKLLKNPEERTRLLGDLKAETEFWQDFAGDKHASAYAYFVKQTKPDDKEIAVELDAANHYQFLHNKEDTSILAKRRTIDGRERWFVMVRAPMLPALYLHLLKRYLPVISDCLRSNDHQFVMTKYPNHAGGSAILDVVHELWSTSNPLENAKGRHTLGLHVPKEYLRNFLLDQPHPSQVNQRTMVPKDTWAHVMAQKQQVLPQTPKAVPVAFATAAATTPAPTTPAAMGPRDMVSSALRSQELFEETELKNAEVRLMREKNIFNLMQNLGTTPQKKYGTPPKPGGVSAHGVQGVPFSPLPKGPSAFTATAPAPAMHPAAFAANAPAPAPSAFFGSGGPAPAPAPAPGACPFGTGGPAAGGFNKSQ